MFFYRHKLADLHLHKYEAEMHRRFLEGKTTLVSHLTGMKAQVHKFYVNDSKEWIYFAINNRLAKQFYPKISRLPNPSILGFCSLAKIPRWVALETNILYVNPECRGNGVASLLYDSVLKDGVILISGGSHNVKSRRLWMRMVQNTRYMTWAHDLLNLDRFCEVEVVDDKIQSELKLYQDIKKLNRKKCEDIRIIAFNPRYINEPTSA